MCVVHQDRMVEASVLCVILPVEMSSVFLFVFMCLTRTDIDTFYLCWSLLFYTALYSIIDALEHKFCLLLNQLDGSVRHANAVTYMVMQLCSTRLLPPLQAHTLKL